MDIPVKIKIADKTYDMWAKTPDEESVMREAGKIVDAQVKRRMMQVKGEVNKEEILSMVCVDAMVARLKGDHDLEVIHTEVFRRLEILQKSLGLSGN